MSAALYTSYGYPWFDLYDEFKSDIVAVKKLRGIRSTGQLDKKKGTKQPGDYTVKIPDTQVVILPKK